jgi:hypothetical protein
VDSPGARSAKSLDAIIARWFANGAETGPVAAHASISLTRLNNGPNIVDESATNECALKAGFSALRWSNISSKGGPRNLSLAVLNERDRNSPLSQPRPFTSGFMKRLLILLGASSVPIHDADFGLIDGKGRK